MSYATIMVHVDVDEISDARLYLAVDLAKGFGATLLGTSAALARLAFHAPLAPVGRPHVDPLLRLRVDPSGENPPTGEHECVRTVTIKHREFEIAVEGCAGDRLPHICLIRRPRKRRLDLDQRLRKESL